MLTAEIILVPPWAAIWCEVRRAQDWAGRQQETQVETAKPPVLSAGLAPSQFGRPPHLQGPGA
ncbi:hypothetical protein GCM10010103_57110 [Streptomyces paradoxus]